MTIEHLPNSTRHRWDIHNVKRIPACEASDNNDRTERTCEKCGLVKITVHPPQGNPWIEFRHPNGAAMALDHTPPCTGTIPAVAAADS